MVASQIHLVRHGEVHNPTRILYGRLEGFGLSALGHSMAAAASADLDARERTYARLIASPLQRTQESAAPIAERLGLDIETDDRVIEPHNYFEGKRMSRALRNPLNWHALRDPSTPSWGEPYALVAARMLSAITAVWSSTPEGDVVIVSHQLPIWMVHSQLAGIRLPHDPRNRRCALSSITTLEHNGERFVEVGYSEPAEALSATADDVGAV